MSGIATGSSCLLSTSCGYLTRRRGQNLMPTSAVRSFADPDDFAAAIRASRTEITITGRGLFAAELVRIDLHRLWMQRLDDNLPRVAHTANQKGRAIILFRGTVGPSMVRNGKEVHRNNLLRCSDGQISDQRSEQGSSWASMSLPIDDMAAIGATVAGADFSPPGHEMTTTPAPDAMAQLLRLHAATVYLARHAPEMIAQPQVAHSLEQTMIQSMVACLRPAETHADTAASRRHYDIMKRFRATMEANPTRAIHLPELCVELGISDRTLRACCQEHLGVSPIRYLWLRRMNLARRALKLADRPSATVTDIATAYGFWELGRFAVDYRSLFGEGPSATLHRPR
jgi:AraC-like DNA-binding protein